MVVIRMRVGGVLISGTKGQAGAMKEFVFGGFRTLDYFFNEFVNRRNWFVAGLSQYLIELLDGLAEVMENVQYLNGHQGN